MKLSISDKDCIIKFIASFKGATNVSNILTILPKESGLYVQGLDDSHSGLIVINISNEWFDQYSTTGENTFYLSSGVLHKVLNCWSDGYMVELIMEEDTEDLLITFKGDKLVTKHFKITTLALDIELQNIPDMNYDIDLTIYSVAFKSMIDELSLFDDTINIKCSDENVKLTSSGDEGSASIIIKEDDILEYCVAIADKEVFSQSISQRLISVSANMSSLNKEVIIHIDKNAPLLVIYYLDKKSYVKIYSAPKFDDN